MIILFQKEVADYLGKIYHTLELHNKNKGQFSTPFHLGRGLGALNVQEIEKKLLLNEEIIVTDPACGSGSLILGLINSLDKKGIKYKNRVKFHCNDLDENCVFMSYVQMTLAGVKAKCTYGNAITGERFSCYYTIGNIL